MKKYFAQLQPYERRLVIGVAVVLLIVLNWAFIWPRFSDYGAYRNRRDNAHAKLLKYQRAVAEQPELQKKIKNFESEGEFVALEDQGINFMRTVQNQSAQSGVQVQNTSRPTTNTNDVFFVEQSQNITVLAEEAKLVDFLYKLGSGSSMIRVRDLTLQPDAPHQRLAADIRLVASYQKNSAAAAAKKTANAKVQ
jgi:Tfp pilus assembly protein PilO